VDIDTVPADLPTGRSFLMDLYAESAMSYMTQTGATREDFARVVVKNQRHGLLNPLAQYGAAMTVEQVLAAREIVWPFTLPMCSPISDGAAAALLVSEDFLTAGAPTVEVLASVLRTASLTRADRVTAIAADAAYEMASMEPDDLDVVEVHAADFIASASAN